MKIITLLLLLTCLLPHAQKPAFTQLLYVTSSGNHFLHTAEQIGNKTNSLEKAGRKMFYPKDSMGSRYLIKKAQSQKAYLQKQKFTAAEYEHFRQNVLAEGFLQSMTPGKMYTELFQKKDITIRAIAETNQEEKHWYHVVIEKKALPRIRDLQYAEDLLLFDSHQHLVMVFGFQNVKKDLFYKANGAVVDCSVIYPASSREVVFLWHDPANLGQLQSIRIGGNTHTRGALRQRTGMAQNQWISKQGLYATMTLNQLQTRNGNALNFYGWGGGSKGTLCQNNSGAIDFSGIDLAFSCLNCNDDAYYGKQRLASDRAIEDGRRIFIATMIFYPPAGSAE